MAVFELALCAVEEDVRVGALLTNAAYDDSLASLLWCGPIVEMPARCRREFCSFYVFDRTLGSIRIDENGSFIRKAAETFARDDDL